MKKTETQKEKIMRLLDCSEAEAEDIIKADKMIDKGEKMEFDLPLEQEKVSKKYRNCNDRKKPIIFDNKPRERKENATKSGIIQYLFECLKDYNNVVITNKERQISFSLGDNNFELTLVQKRKK